MKTKKIILPESQMPTQWYNYNRQNEMRRSSEPDATFRGLK